MRAREKEEKKEKNERKPRYSQEKDRGRENRKEWRGMGEESAERVRGRMGVISPAPSLPLAIGDE